MAKRWTGEWLVAVDEEGCVVLPVDPDGIAPTHYRVEASPFGKAKGSIVLIPMKVATVEDLRPESEPEPTIEKLKEEAVGATRKQYTPEERASLEYKCPFCHAEPGEGCFAQPSMRPLTDYPENPNWVHARRLHLVTAIIKEHS